MYIVDDTNTKSNRVLHRWPNLYDLLISKPVSSWHLIRSFAFDLIIFYETGYILLGNIRVLAQNQFKCPVFADQTINIHI